MQDQRQLIEKAVESIIKFVDLVFAGEYFQAAHDIDRVVGQISAVSNVIIDINGTENEFFRILQLFLGNIVRGLEVNDIYLTADSLLQISDLFGVLRDQLQHSQ
ncbi:MAG: hypothetical protein ACYC4H_05735 [Desulfocucumaceae bacterium]